MLHCAAHVVGGRCKRLQDQNKEQRKRSCQPVGQRVKGTHTCLTSAAGVCILWRMRCGCG
jgi:hypothetical protein